MTLQDRLNAFKADFEAGKPPYNVPPYVIAAMHRATAELIASRQAERAKKAGDIAPAFTLNDQDGHSVNSAALLEQDLVLTPDNGTAHITQDELGNTYDRVGGPYSNYKP